MIAVLNASIVLIPCFIGIKTGRAESAIAEFSLENRFHMQDILSKFFTGSFNITEIQNFGMPPLFCGVIINLLVLLYFMNSKIKTREKIASFALVLIFFISFYFEGINNLWTMGNKPAWYMYRYSFCFSFILIFLAFKSFENLKEGTQIWQIIFAIFVYHIVAILAIGFELKTINEILVRVDMILALILGTILILKKIEFKAWKKPITSVLTITLLIISAGNIIINAEYCMKVLKDEGSRNTMSHLKTLFEFNENRFNQMKTDDNSIYRVEAGLRLTANDGLAFGVNKVDFSGSTYSSELYDFLTKLGFSSEHVLVTSDTGNTKTMDMLFGVKYLSKVYYMKETKDYDVIYKDKLENRVQNPYALSLAFGVPKTVLNEIIIDTKNTFEYQNKLMQNISGIEEDIFVKASNVQKSLENLEVTQSKYVKQNKEEAGKISYNIKIEREDDIYLYLKGHGLEAINIYINGENIKISPLGNKSKLFHLGKYKKGEEVLFEVELNGTDVILEEYLYYERGEIIEKCYSLLQKEQVQLEKETGRKYKGKVNIDGKEKYIIFTIPFDKGWTANVDGKEAEIIQVQEMLMAVKVPEGEHEIEISFIPQGFVSGLSISLLRYNSNYFVLCYSKKAIKHLTIINQMIKLNH